MNIEHITQKKQKDIELTQKEIEFAVRGFLQEKITKNQMANFLHATVRKGLNEKETVYLTKAMLNSGKVYDLSAFKNTIDKHSTGGVGDNTTLIVVPLFACFGFTCVKMSGGALGHTGGTADKLSVFEGMNLTPNKQELKQIAEKTGGCFITSSHEVAPADKKIYALRDEVGAMSIPLIASSIMSKKIATGSKNLVLDVKFGNGALVESKKDAKKLAKLMQKIGESSGINTTYVLGDMNQPLGTAVGNKAEVCQVLFNLKSAAKTRLLHHSLIIVATALSKQLKVSKRKLYKQAYQMVKEGLVFEKLKEIVTQQGGKFSNDFTLKPQAVVPSERTFKIKRVNTKQLGLLDKQFKQDYKAYQGFEILVRSGHKVKKGQPVFNLYFKPKNLNKVSEQLLGVFNSEK